MDLPQKSPISPVFKLSSPPAESTRLNQFVWLTCNICCCVFGMTVLYYIAWLH